MSHPPRSRKITSLEQWRIVFLNRLYWLIVAWIIALFSLAILSGLTVIVLPSGLLPVLFGGASLGLFRLFGISQTWLFKDKTHTPPVTPPQSRTPV